MAVQRWPITTRDEWLERRKRYVGGSECAAEHNCHPYKLTRLKLSVRLRGVEFSNEDNKVMRRGRWMEPAIGKAVAELRPDWEVIPANDFYFDDETRMCATPDFYVKAARGTGTLQTKSARYSVWHEHYLDGTEVPLHVLLQASWEAMLVNADFAAVAVMLVDPDNMDCKIFEFDRNRAVEAKLAAVHQEFMAEVAAGREPEPDFAKDAETIRALFPHETPGTAIDLSGDNRLPGLLAERADLSAACKDMDKRVDEIEAELRFLMKDAEIATLPGWRLTNKTSDFKGYTVQPRSSRVLRVYDRREKEMQS